MLKVIGAGVGRTGTTSLKAALDSLGFGPCHHFTELTSLPDRVPLWQRAARGETVDWEEVYDGYRSTVDWPGTGFWRELAARYPEAKVILTVRDPERWYDSQLANYQLINNYQAAPPPMPEATRQAYASLTDLVTTLVWDGLFSGQITDKDHAIRAVAAHNDAVVREIFPGRLLVFDVNRGWKPLCDFLDVPVPDEPFPHLNDRATHLATAEEVIQQAASDPTADTDTRHPRHPPEN